MRDILTSLIDVSYSRRLHPIEAKSIITNTYLKTFSPAVLRENDAELEDKFYNSIARESTYDMNRLTTAFDNMNAYVKSDMLKVLGISLKEAMCLPENEFNFILSFLQQHNKEELKAMKKAMDER